MRQAVTLAAFAALALASARAQAAPDDDLDRARQLFRQHDWSGASKELDALLYPTLRLPERANAVEAHILFGACELELGDAATAHDEFDKALALDAERTLDTLSFSPAAIKLLEDVKVERRVAAERANERLSAARERERVQTLLKNAVFFQSHRWWASYVPFGFGQYENNENAKGVAFTVGEVTTLGASVGIWYYLVNKYGLRGTVPLTDAPGVRHLQQVEIGSGLLFLGLVIYGVVDARLHYTPDTKVDPDSVPPELRYMIPGAKPAKPTAPKTSFHFGPVLVPSGAGVGLSWER